MALSGFLTTSAMNKVANPLLSMAHDDKVPNVRLNALKAVHEIKRNLKDKSFEEKAKKCFSDCKDDKDMDVAAFAKKFLQS